MTTKIGKVVQVDLRNVWKHEALDFTKWLAEDEGLQLLSEAVGIELEDAQPETSVGAFSLDILAKESGTDRKVVIENQLEDTNHDHLGKLLTYAAGLDAAYAIWVVKHAREEHAKAIEWLNEVTGMDRGFFLVEVSAVKIGDSLPAPVLSVVEKPNDWAKTSKASEGMREIEKLRLAYWQRYVELAAVNPEFTKRMKYRKPSTDHWSTIGMGPKYYIGLTLIVKGNGALGVELYVPNDKEIGHKAIENKEVFEKALELEAEPFDANKASGVRFFRYGCDFRKNQDKWDEYIEWHLDTAIKMYDVIKALNL